MQVRVADAKKKLLELIKAVEDKLPVTICPLGCACGGHRAHQEPCAQETKAGYAERPNSSPRPKLVEAHDRLGIAIIAATTNLESSLFGDDFYWRFIRHRLQPA